MAKSVRTVACGCPLFCQVRLFGSIYQKGVFCHVTGILRYKGRPLVRSGDTLYYGSMGDKCVAHLQIKSNKQDHGLNMADKVVIQLISTDETLPLKDRMLNKAERDGLYEALSIASIWMDRHNKKEQ